MRAQQASKNPADATPSIVMTKIDVRPWNRREQDIPSWRIAHKSAEAIIPRRLSLYDLYADVELDGHVEAVTAKRRDAVTTANWQFVDKEGKPIDQINELIDSIGFEELLEEILNSKFWGYSILEPTFWKSHDGTAEMAANLLPRLNYRPELGIIADDYISDDGINIREGFYAKTVMEVGKVKDLGLHLKSAPYAILKRGNLGDWSLFVQVFGNPIVDATWDGFDETQRLKLLEAVQALGSGGALVRPAGTEVKLLASTANANGDLQDKLMAFLNKEISKVYLGSTETTESSKSSGYAQSETHADQDERKNESDLNFVRRILNSRFTKILNSAGFDLSGGHFVIEGESNELTTKESFEIHKGLKDAFNLPMDDDFLYETYGVPKPANYDKLKSEQEDPPAPLKGVKTPPKGGQGGKTPPSGGRGAKEDLTFKEQFLNLFSGFFPSAPIPVGATSLPLKGETEGVTCCSETHLIQLKAKTEPNYSALWKSIKKAKGEGFLYPALVWKNIEILTDGFTRGWKGEERMVNLADFGIEYGALDPKMQTAWEMNLFRFSTVKAAYQSQEVNEIFRKSKSFAEFERLVNQLYEVKDRNHLITEYNTAYQTGEAASTYYRLMGKINTFPYWQYKTIGDDRVRDSHRALHDVILPANHPLWAKVYPPNGWGCRCYVVPRLANEVDKAKVEQDIAFVTDYIATNEEWVKARKDGFAVNRAMTKEVFVDKQQYSAAPDKVLQKASKMTATEWNLRKAAEIQAGKEKDYTESDPKVIDEIWAKYQANDVEAILPDYAARPISLSKAILAGANSASSVDYKLLGALEELLKSPDEVWAASEVMNQLVYMKYYKNEILKATTKITDKGELQLIKWESVQANAEASRRGLVIRK